MWCRVFSSCVMVFTRGNNGVGGSFGVEWCLGVWRWWRRVLMVSMVWGVNVISIREGMFWVWCGGLGFCN